MEGIIRVLSKRSLRRVDILKILVTVGSMQGRSFKRLFNIIDELCNEGVIKGEDLVAQTGFDNYQSEFYKTFDLIGDEQFKKIISEVDVVISHAGTGTVTSSLKAGKKVILFPRLSKYEEHYDDHQLELCELFVDNGCALCAKDKEELRNCILHIDEFKPQKFVSNKDNFNRLVIDFIESF